MVDVTEFPELRRIAEEVQATGTAVVLGTEQGEVAKIVPWPAASDRPQRAKTDKDLQDFLSAFGGWHDVDTDELKARMKASRSSKRPPVDL